MRFIKNEPLPSAIPDHVGAGVGALDKNEINLQQQQQQQQQPPDSGKKGVDLKFEKAIKLVVCKL